MRVASISIAIACLVAGCPRAVPTEDGGRGDRCTSHDGLPLEGPIVLDDARVEDLNPSCLPAGATPCRPPHMGRVVSVTDGDTLRVEGTVPEVFSLQVRLIGVDTPEIAHDGMPAQCFGDQARAFTDELRGRLVWLTFDSGCMDPFNRHLAYVHVGTGTHDLWQRQLLSRGFARVLTVSPNRTFSRVFEGLEAEATEQRLGLWGGCR